MMIWDDERIAFAITDTREDLIRRGFTPGIVDSYLIMQRVRDEYEQRIAELEIEVIRANKLKAENTALLEVVKLVYRKHELCDDSVGWLELGNKLGDVLCNTMGSKEFVNWLYEQGVDDG